MAQFSVGLNTNKTAQQYGYDQYKTTLRESLGAVASDNWRYNPFLSLFTAYELNSAKSKSLELDIEPINRHKLNKEYERLGLYFEADEYKSVVDIMVTAKKEELERQSIMARGPSGSWNPLNSGFYVGAAKLGVGVGVSFLDPINIGASFIPVFGQANFVRVLARTGFKTARAVRGAVEGAVGATVLEPLVYSSAQSIQADYDLQDSFMNIAFGTVLGSGLHVGAGALKDINTANKFHDQITNNRKNLESGTGGEGSGTGGEPELNLYKQYYPENSEFMMKLEQTDPRTRQMLLAKAIGDLSLGQPVNVLDIVNADPILNNKMKTLDNTIVNVRKQLSDAQNIKVPQRTVTTVVEGPEGPVTNKKIIIDEEASNKKTELVGSLTRKYQALLAERKILNNPPKTEITSSSKKTFNDAQLIKDNTSIENLNLTNQDSLMIRTQKDLLDLRNAQTVRGLDLKTDFVNEGIPDILTNTTEALNDFNTNVKKIEETVTDFINCSNGR